MEPGLADAAVARAVAGVPSTITVSDAGAGRHFMGRTVIGESGRAAGIACEYRVSGATAVRVGRE